MLTSRFTDRPLRPMMPKAWQNDTQVLSWLMSYDGNRQAEPLAMTSAGAALAISGLPSPTPTSPARPPTHPFPPQGASHLVIPHKACYRELYIMHQSPLQGVSRPSVMAALKLAGSMMLAHRRRAFASHRKPNTLSWIDEAKQ